MVTLDGLKEFWSDFLDRWKRRLGMDLRSSIGAMETVQERMKSQKIGKIELHALKFEMLDPHVLKPNEYNPNRQEEAEFELLRLSIRKDGFTLPIVANMDNTIIDGEHRWRAALAEGLKEIPVVHLDLNETRMKLSTIRHNKARGTHDADLEALIFKDLEVLMGRGFILGELQMDEKVLDQMLNFESAPLQLAGDEYGDSWTPVKSESVVDMNAAGEPDSPAVFRTRTTVDSAVILRSATEGANLLAFRKVMKKDAEAGREKLYTLSAVVNPQDAEVIRVFLEDSSRQGDTPAERLYFFLKDGVQ